MGIRLRIGSPVSGEDFFGRKSELAKASNLIENNNLMLAAPRRVGKTSFAQKMLEIQGLKKWNTIFIDLEEITSIESFLASLYRAILNIPEVAISAKISAKIRSWFSKLEVSTSVMPINAKVTLDNNATNIETLASILNSLEHHTLVVFDELTVLLESLSCAHNYEVSKIFLNQFRALRMATAEKCSWLVCSSIGVRNFTSQHNMSDTINDIADFELGAFSNQEAMEFTRQLSASMGMQMEESTLTYLLDKIGWNIPYFIQLLLSKLPLDIISTDNIDEAYSSLLQTGAFDTWNERLGKEYGANEKAAKIILQYLCLTNDGKRKEEIYNYLNAIVAGIENDRLSILLRTLITDGYIVKDKCLYRFHSPLLRDYWRETYCN